MGDMGKVWCINSFLMVIVIMKDIFEISKIDIFIIVVNDIEIMIVCLIN